MHTVKARLHRFALIAYWRVRLALICHLINEIDHELRSLMQQEHHARRLQLIEAERRQEGVIKQRQAMDALDALTLGQREPEPTDPTPRRREHDKAHA